MRRIKIIWMIQPPQQSKYTSWALQHTPTKNLKCIHKIAIASNETTTEANFFNEVAQLFWLFTMLVISWICNEIFWGLKCMHTVDLRQLGHNQKNWKSQGRQRNLYFGSCRCPLIQMYGSGAVPYQRYCDRSVVPTPTLLTSIIRPIEWATRHW